MTKKMERGSLFYEQIVVLGGGLHLSSLRPNPPDHHGLRRETNPPPSTITCYSFFLLTENEKFEFCALRFELILLLTVY